jgi:hypothetical protein
MNDEEKVLLKLEEVKQVTGNMVYSTLAHFLDSHTTSEREQELLQTFTHTIADVIENMEIRF